MLGRKAFYVVTGAIIVGLATGIFVLDRVTRGPFSRGEEGPSIKWTKPLAFDAIDVGTLEEVQKLAPFPVRKPGISTRPTLIQVSDPSRVSPEKIIVAFVYQLRNRGPVVVEESKSQFGQSELEAWAKQLPSGSATIVDVKQTRGVLIYKRGPGSIQWLEGQVRFLLTGPNLGREGLIDLAHIV